YAIRKAGCASEGDASISAEVLKCLQELPAADVDQLAHQMEAQTMDFRELVVVDGDFLPDTPWRMLTTGNHKRNLSLLASTVEDEASFLLHFFGSDPRFRAVSPERLSLQEAQTYLL